MGKVIVVLVALGAGAVSYSVLAQWAASEAKINLFLNADRAFSTDPGPVHRLPWFYEYPTLIPIGIALVVLVIGLLIVKIKKAA